MTSRYKPTILLLIAAFIFTGCQGSSLASIEPTKVEVTKSTTQTLAPTSRLATAVTSSTAVVLPDPTTKPPQIVQTQSQNHPAYTYACDLTGSSLPIYSFEIINTYPHDPDAYTQGLIFRDGVLYESTGLYGQSSLRKVELSTGKVLQSYFIPEQYFAEGLVDLDGKLFQLAWREGAGFVYDINTFDKIDEFSYPTEGWGLTHDGSQLIMSDGTNYVYYLDPQSYQETRRISVEDERGLVTRINELEYLPADDATRTSDEVWGNIYQTACIVRFDPITGKVTGWIDLSGLYEKLGGAISGVNYPEVPNGIAISADSDRIFVTGKFWPQLFEIRLVQRGATP